MSLIVEIKGLLDEYPMDQVLSSHECAALMANQITDIVGDPASHNPDKAASIGYFLLAIARSAAAQPGKAVTITLVAEDEGVKPLDTKERDG